MKRTNVAVDAQLLEKARQLSEKKTDSATVKEALELFVRHKDSRRAFREFAEMAAKGGVFDPDYVKEKLANSTRVDRPKRISAHEKRVPR